MINALALAESGRLPDSLIRMGIRQRLRDGIREEARRLPEGPGPFLEEIWSDSPIALHPDLANQQHYELPPEYFQSVLGPRLKYSSGYWPADVDSLEASETAALALVARRAGIGDGQRVLDLGCGWGSFTLYAARHYPDASFVAVSNSAVQRAFIEERAGGLGLGNVQVITADMNQFEPPGVFDRVVSIEMFEHMRNHPALMRKVAAALKPGGKLFVHIFAHNYLAYLYRHEEQGEWMARHFFTGGIMPSHDMLMRCQGDLVLEADWRLNGIHYQRTLEAWLQRHDAKLDTILPLFEKTYGGAKAARLWSRRWRIFYLACSELFGYDGGREWQVSHYRFAKPD